MDLQNTVTGAAATTALVMMLINAIVQNWPEDRPKTFANLLDTIWQWARKSAMSYMSTRMGSTPIVPPAPTVPPVPNEKRPSQ